LDHSEVYNYADHTVEAPIQTVDASIIPQKKKELFSFMQAACLHQRQLILANLRLDESSRRAVRISRMLAKRMMLAQYSKRSIEYLITFTLDSDFRKKLSPHRARALNVFGHVGNTMYK
jgi:hypothetical protein